MKKLTKLMALLLAVLMLCAVVTGCSGKTVTEEPAPAAKEETPAKEAPAEDAPVAEEAEEGPISVTVGTTTSSGSFDNTVMSSNVGYMLVYDSILARDTDGNIIGNIAESYEYTDDTTLVLTIRDDVYFSNGKLCTPEDVLFSIERFISTNSAFVSTTFYDKILFDECSIDGNQLTIKLADPCSGILASFCNPKWSFVLCKSYVESTGDDEFWDAPVGTGPYTCTANIADSYMTFEKRADYWGEEPQVDEFTIKYYPEETTMFIDFENGVLDMCLGVSDADLTRVQNGEVGGWFTIGSEHDLVMICLPEYVEAFNDINVRKAIAMALDSESLTETAFGQLGVVSTSTLMSDSVGYVNMGAYEYDPDQARQILEDAGYAEGDLSFRMVIVNFPANEKLAEAMQSQLADIGIDLQVESYDIGTAMSYFMNSDLDISIGEGSVPCADAAQLFAMAKPTHTNACMIQTDDEIVDLLYSAEAEMDADARADLYAKVQEWFFNNYRWLPICEKKSANVYSDRITSWDTYWTSVYTDLKAIEVQ